MKKIHWILIGIGSTTLVAIVTTAIILVWYFHSRSEPSPEEASQDDEPSEINCDHITLKPDWQTYSDTEGFGYTIKYPSNWQVSEELFEGHSYWKTVFGPEGNISETAAIFIGEANYHTLDGYRHLLSEGTSPPYILGDNEQVIVDGNNATRFTLELQGLEQYKYILYYVPYTYLNINKLFEGNTEESIRRNNCEAEVFYTMLGSYTHGQEYKNDECGFSFRYPLNWEIDCEYYYETAGGIKATSPTIHLNETENTNSNDWIRLNPRQSDCYYIISPTIEVEYINGNKVTFYSNETQGAHCIEAEIEAKDKNGKKTTFNWLSFTDNEEIQEIFKQIINTFEML